MAAKKGADAPKALDAPKQPLNASQPLDEVLTRLATRRKLLNSLDDVISDSIRRVEAMMRDHVATRISVRVKEYDDGDVMLLSFSKINNHWTLAIETGDPAPEAPALTKTALLASSRANRSLVFAEGHVERLIRAAHDQIEQQITEREQAIASATSLIEALDAFAVDDPPPVAEDFGGFGPDSEPR